MNASWLKIAAGAAVALIVVVIALRSRQPSQEPNGAAAKSAPAAESAKPGARVEQRLQQLRDAHDRIKRGDTMAAAPGAPPVGRPLPPMRAPGSSAPSSATGAPPVPAGADDDKLDIDPDDIPTLRTVALTDTDPERRLAAVTLLGSSEDAQVIPILTQALSDKDEDVRMAAVQSLADFTGEAPVEAIEMALNDQSSEIRYEAVEILSDIGGDRARSAIERALNDPDEDVRSLAEGILDLEETYDDSAEGGTGSPTPPPQPMR